MSIVSQKDGGLLKAFDPSASYVHPKSRPNLVLKLNKRHTSIASSQSVVSESDFNDDEESTDDEDDGHFYRATRSQKTQRPNLRHRLVQTAGVQSDAESFQGRLRSSRGQTKRKRSEVSPEFGDDQVSESVSSRVKPKTGRRARAPKAAYGVVRAIADLDDACLPDDGNILGRHRGFCEKCHQAPAHELIARLKKQGKNRKKKRRKAESDLEASEDELEKFEALGGWVRW